MTPRACFMGKKINETTWPTNTKKRNEEGGTDESQWIQPTQTKNSKERERENKTRCKLTGARPEVLGDGRDARGDAAPAVAGLGAAAPAVAGLGAAAPATAGLGATALACAGLVLACAGLVLACAGLAFACAGFTFACAAAGCLAAVGCSVRWVAAI